jgi:low temperature requirement protein LtrA
LLSFESMPGTRHLRPRGGGAARTTNVELFFDLVYVFAVTQLSHLILGDLSIAGLARAAFLLVVVWWAWIYTAWMTNWFDPTEGPVGAVLGGVMLASLLAAAALPHAFGNDALLFAASYVALQVGRNAAAMSFLGRDHHLRDVFERIFAWSVISGALWLAGALFGEGARLAFWIPAFVLDLGGPIAGYWLPGRGRAATTDYDIEGAHFAERCQLFVLIALGESIVVTGGTAAHHGLGAGDVGCLVLAFVETIALWWLYFGPAGEGPRQALLASADPGKLARDAYTYVHVVIVAGIVLVAVADDLLIGDPGATVDGVALAVVVAGPALFLAGTALFEWMTTRVANAPRLGVAALIGASAALGAVLPIVALSSIVTALLCGLAAWEMRVAGSARVFLPT